MARTRKLTNSTTPAAPSEERIPLKRQTAANIGMLLRARDEAAAVLASIENRLADTVRTLYTERDIAEGRILELTDGPTPELVVVVLKRVPTAD
ncbi:MAG: hypothetical protein JWM71_1876 [Solirubrobacteraceae bacterium]|nr:hypothetical protein [Solirubrobacteraceae bacterium]